MAKLTLLISLPLEFTAMYLPDCIPLILIIVGDRICIWRRARTAKIKEMKQLQDGKTFMLLNSIRSRINIGMIIGVCSL